MKTTNTTLRAIFTPAYDRTIGQAYTGNHAGYRVSFLRDGDKLTVEHHGCKGFGPCRPLLESS